MTSEKRIETLFLVATTSKSVRGKPVESGISEEFKELRKVARANGRRNDLLQGIHTSRVLDSFLKALIDGHSISGAGTGMGGYLTALANHRRTSIGRLPEGRRRTHQNDMVNVRNELMHQAGHFPTTGHANALYNAMHACLTDVAALE